MLKVWKKKYDNTSQKKDGVAILTSAKVDFRAKNINISVNIHVI